MIDRGGEEENGHESTARDNDQADHTLVLTHQFVVVLRMLAGDKPEEEVGSFFSIQCNVSSSAEREKEACPTSVPSFESLFPVIPSYE